MHAASELILRYCRSNPDCGKEPDGGSEPRSRQLKILLINPPRDSLANTLMQSGANEVKVFTQDFGDHQFFESGGVSSEFGLLPQEQDIPGHVILFLPREKERLEFLLHFLATFIPADGTLWLVGENKAGIKSAEGRLKTRFRQVHKLDTARHCVLYQAQYPSAARLPLCMDAPVPRICARMHLDRGAQDVRERSKDARERPPTGELPPTTGSPTTALTHTAGSAFSIDAYRHHWTVPTPQGELHLQSLPGAFAHGRLDKGTALLLQYLYSSEGQKLKIKGKVLDFGCGAGVIGLSLKQQSPNLSLDMLDSSAIALESTRLSLELNHHQANIIAADGLETLKARYDWIISNPPFHKGVSANLSIARKMMTKAPALLGNRGKILLVCNRHLPYEAWLGESFSGLQEVSENREFKVLLARGPRRVAGASHFV